MPRLSAPRLAAILLVVLAAGTLVVGRSCQSARAAAVARRDAHFVWPRGGRWLYAIHWDATTRRTMPGAQGEITGGALIDGDVSVRSLGADGAGATTLVFALESIERYEVRLGQQNLITDGDRALAIASLVGQEALVVVDVHGVVASIAYHSGEASTTRQQVRQIVQMMRVTLPADGASTWAAQEPTPNGLARVRYRNEGDFLERIRVSYDGLAAMAGPDEPDQKLSSRAKIRVTPAGVVGSIEDDERLEARGSMGLLVSSWTYRASLLGTSQFDPRVVRDDDLDQAAGSAQDDRDKQRRQDERLSRGWALDSIELELLIDGKGEKIEPTFVARAGAFVRLHPEVTDNLVAWFEDPRLSDLGRQLTLDVLSGAGSDEAQDAMRRAMTSRAVSLPAHTRAALVQRFIFLTSPNPESARFVAQLYDQERATGDPQVALASAVALGAVIEHLEANGSPELARALDERLRRDLAQRRSAKEINGLLQALGNAHEPEDLPAILAFAKDEGAGTRERVARSLGSFNDPQASGTLLVLTGDASPLVEEAALRSLREESLGDDDWAHLAARVEAGRTSAYGDSELVDLLARRADAAKTGEGMLRFVLERTPDTDGNLELRDRIAQLLGRHGD